MARPYSVTDPAAEVSVTASITQKMREDLRTLSFAKEHLTLKLLFAKLIQNYLDENASHLEALAEWRKNPATPPSETVAAPIGEAVAVVPTSETVVAN